ESKQEVMKIAAYFEKVNTNQLQLVSLLQKLEGKNKLPKNFRDVMDELLVLDQDVVIQNYTEENRKHDRKVLKALRALLKEKAGENANLKREFNTLLAILKDSIEADFPREMITGRSAQNLKKLVEEFMSVVRNRLQNSEKAIEFAKLFSPETIHPELKFETLGLTEASLKKKSGFLTATQKEFATGELLTESDYIPAHIQEARSDWKKVMAEAKSIPA